jgi:phage major head subunit gpT-like protein
MTLQKGGVQTPEVQNALKMLMEIPQRDWKGLYRWFLGLPLMRHWIGDRQALQLVVEGFEVLQKPWESTLEVLRDDLKYDNLGGYRPTIAEMANEVLLLKYRELIRLMEDARTGTIYGNCFDGYPLISASHGTGTNSGTAALTASALDDAIDAMKAQHDVTNTDDRLLINPTHLWYHPALRSTVRDILDMDLVASAGTSTTHTDTTIRNPHYKALEPIELPMGSSYTAYWGLFADRPGSELGPVLWQYDPAGGDFTSLDSPNDMPNFMRRQLLFGTEMWGAIAPGFPQFVWGSNGTT